MNYPYQIIGQRDNRSAAVKQIQKHLNQILNSRIVEDGIFGKQTLNSVKHFQSMYCDLFGLPLKIDGMVGRSTWASLFGHTQMLSVNDSPLSHDVIKIAHAEIGVKEDPPGSNKGPCIKEYLRSVGLCTGKAWCAAFVFWCFEQASARQNRVNPLIRTAGCLHHWRMTRGETLAAAMAIANPGLIEPGSIFIVDRSGGKGHTGIVTGIFNGYLTTIEGNTNNMHSAEGEGVYHQERKITSVNIGYIKYC